MDAGIALKVFQLRASQGLGGVWRAETPLYPNPRPLMSFTRLNCGRRVTQSPCLCAG